MNRSELLAILNELVRRNAITIEEAQLVLNRFDAGDLEDVPLPSNADGLLSGTHDDWIAALALLLLLLNGSPGRTLTAQERKKAQKLLRSQFEASTTRLGFGVVEGAIAITTWQRGMQTALSNYSRQMAVAGAGKMPSVATQSTIEDKLAEQWSYLQRFATQIMVGKVANSQMSDMAVISRSTLYGGVGWGSYFIANEEQGGVGWVANYISLDDRRTCSPCVDAARGGPYLLGQGPMPGTICLGGGACRCRRETVYDPVAYARLAA